MAIFMINYKKIRRGYLTVALKFCGGAQTVTGSMHLVSTNLSNVLLDCGLFHGKRDDYYLINSHFSFDPQNIDALVVSHAHIDHCGNTPTLIKQGFRGSIYSTPVTRDLCRYMLPDSGFVQEEDIKYVNKINKRRGLPPRQPLYTSKDAERSLRFFRTLDYHKRLSVTKDMDLLFYDSGHILGSTIPVLEIKTSKSKMKIAYAVDLGRQDMPLLRNPEVPKDVNYLIIESTYGGKKHEDIDDIEDVFVESINRALNRGGKVIIPAFALERTQLIVYFISELMKKKRIKTVPIFVDGPLAVNVTKVFRENPEYFEDEVKRAFMSRERPLDYAHVTYLKNVNESKKLNDVTKPVIIISASGMCENGRILHHLKNNIENPKNMILIIGYMAEDTLGRRIEQKHPTVRIFGRPYEAKAEVVSLNAFSAHADKQALVEYVASCRENLKGVFIVHGEMEQAEILKSNLSQKLNIKARIPAKDEIVYLKSK